LGFEFLDHALWPLRDFSSVDGFAEFS
jgi:hypothetical protein